MRGLLHTIWHLVALLTVKVILIGLLFLVSLLVLFHLIHDVFADGDTGFDQMLFALSDRIRSPGMTRAMRSISFLGSYHYLIVMPALLVLVFSFYKGMRWNGLRVLIISFTTSLLNQFLKNYFGRPRPAFSLLEMSGFSFPSGHTMIGGVFHGLIVYIIWTNVENKALRWVLSLFFTSFVVLVGLSRIYLKVHYATDVAAGYLIGLLWLMLSLYLLGLIERLYLARYKPGPQKQV